MSESGASSGTEDDDGSVVKGPNERIAGKLITLVFVGAGIVTSMAGLGGLIHSQMRHPAPGPARVEAPSEGTEAASYDRSQTAPAVSELLPAETGTMEGADIVPSVDGQIPARSGTMKGAQLTPALEVQMPVRSGKMKRPQGSSSEGESTGVVDRSIVPTRSASVPTRSSYPARSSAPSQCPKNTGGTCGFLSCDRSRGKTTCFNGHCLCQEGYCSNMGACSKQESDVARDYGGDGDCISDTGGTCRFLGCEGFRGQTECRNYRCTCKPGHCSAEGICFPRHKLFHANVASINKYHTAFPGPHGNVVTGVAVSGGGTRSFALAVGQLRALEALGVMQNVDAISAISGGTWATAPYMFAHIDTTELLGQRTDPASLARHVLQRTSSRLGACGTTSKGPIWTDKYMANFPTQRIWEATIGEVFLKPFGLDSMQAYMALDGAAVQRIKQENPDLVDAEFYTIRSGRPQCFIMSGTVLAPQGFSANSENTVALEMSPDFSGVPFVPNDRPLVYHGKFLTDVYLGGGLVETFSFGGKAPRSEDSGLKDLPAPPCPLSLSKAIGISSWGVGGAFSQMNKGGLSLGADFNFEAHLWPVTSPSHPEHQVGMTFQLGDGGNIDDSGLLALLQRGASNVMMLLNTNVPLGMRTDYCAQDPDMSSVSEDIPSELGNKFGITIWSNGIGQFLGNNQVFEKDELASLVCELQTLRKRGAPLVVKRELNVLANAWWGITGGYTAHILFVLNAKCPEFENKLPADTREAIGHWSLKDFPFLDTVSHYYTEQVNLLAAQGEYVIMANAQRVRDLLMKTSEATPS